jgi:Helix-turn-helix domain
MRIKDQPELLDQTEAAKFLGLEASTLQAWRSRRRYDLRHIKVGGRVRYDVKDLLAFLESRKVSQPQA